MLCQANDRCTLAIENVDAKIAADRIMAKVVPLGQRFYPSESAFPLRKSPILLPLFASTHAATEHVASLLVRFALAHKGDIPYGWAPRILTQCGVPYPEVWDILHEMYESQVCVASIDPSRAAFSRRTHRFLLSTSSQTYKPSPPTLQSC